jgi:hypothetical protein
LNSYLLGFGSGQIREEESGPNTRIFMPYFFDIQSIEKGTQNAPIGSWPKNEWASFSDASVPLAFKSVKRVTNLFLISLLFLFL